jgi:D-alanyl-D-alanine carboxypeptidase/D-alanyl-D-alanine-endopeptidase (penicillin-binding protein 4)
VSAGHTGSRGCAELDPLLCTLVDGQGFSTDNKVALQAQVQLLRYLSTQPYFSVFFDSMPIIGVDGSLADVIPPDNPAVGHIHAKTETLVSAAARGNLVLNTKALAGYIDKAHGRWLAFALYLNALTITGIEDVLAANRTLGAMAATIYAEQ